MVYIHVDLSYLSLPFVPFYVQTSVFCDYGRSSFIGQNSIIKLTKTGFDVALESAIGEPLTVELMKERNAVLHWEIKAQH